MRKSFNLLVGVFLFVLVFSLCSVEVRANNYIGTSYLIGTDSTSVTKRVEITTYGNNNFVTIDGKGYDFSDTGSGVVPFDLYIPLPLWNWSGGNPVMCLGDVTAVGIESTFAPEIHVYGDKASSMLHDYSITDLGIGIQDQIFHYREDVWPTGYFDTSNFVGKSIFDQVYVKISMLFSFKVQASSTFSIDFTLTLDEGDRMSFEFYDADSLTESDITDQTDSLTNGFDDSVGEATSNLFSNNVSSYEQAEGNIFSSAKNDLNNFQFYDIGSNSSIVVGLSFVTSTMTAIFNAMGGLNGGAGILLSVLFSVILVSIVIGTYRYFVSSGKAGGSGSKKGGKG